MRIIRIWYTLAQRADYRLNRDGEWELDTFFGDEEHYFYTRQEAEEEFEFLIAQHKAAFDEHTPDAVIINEVGSFGSLLVPVGDDAELPLDADRLFDVDESDYTLRYLDHDDFEITPIHDFPRIGATAYLFADGCTAISAADGDIAHHAAVASRWRDSGWDGSISDGHIKSNTNPKQKTGG